MRQKRKLGKKSKYGQYNDCKESGAEHPSHPFPITSTRAFMRIAFSFLFFCTEFESNDKSLRVENDSE